METSSWPPRGVVSSGAILLLVLLVACVGVAEDGKPASPLKRVDSRSCVFADQELALHYAFSGKEKPGKNVTWKLTVTDRVIASGMQKVEEGGGNFSVAIRTPPLKPGVTVSAKLDVACEIEKGAMTTCTNTLDIFSSDAFSDRSQAIRVLNLQLYDPLGPTTATFAECKIPFTTRRTLAAVDAIESGVLIFGEGLDWGKQPAIAQAAVRAAQRGLIVVCLAPTAGQMALGETGPNSPVVLFKIEITDDQMPRRSDRKPNVASWKEKPSEITKFLVESKGSNRVVRASQTDMGHLWIEASYLASRADRPRGKLILCGYGIIDSWKSNPVPRYVLRGILESCSDSAASIN